MQIIDKTKSNLCSSCVCGTGEQCYCESHDAERTGVNIRIISPFEHLLEGTPIQASEENPLSLQAAQSQQVDVSTHETSEDLSTYFQENGSTNTSQRPEIVNLPQRANRKVTKDNTSHKKISKFLVKCYSKVIGMKIPEKFKKAYYHREDYACRIWTLLEKEGKLNVAYTIFQTAMATYQQEIQGQLAKNDEKAGHLNHLLDLIDRYMTAFEHFMNDEFERSLKTVYDFENMRQKNNFKKAWKELQELRQSLGLPHEIPSQ